MQCEICKSKCIVIWANVKNYTYYQCMACQYLYVYPKPSVHIVEKYYQVPTFYKKAEMEESRLVPEARVRLKRLSKLAEKYGLDKYILDVGCASGIFLEQAIKEGWVVEGVEISSELSTRAREKGLNVVNGWLENLPNNKKYPFVTAWEVIEHSIEPIRFFDKLQSLVQDGGLLAISTPMSNGLPANILRSKFPMISPPEHISLFSNKSIILLGKNFGLQMVRFQSFSNLKRQNLERGFMRLLFDPISFPNTISIKLSLLLAVAFLPITKIMDAMGFGSEMEVIFRRMPS